MKRKQRMNQINKPRIVKEAMTVVVKRKGRNNANKGITGTVGSLSKKGDSKTN